MFFFGRLLFMSTVHACGRWPVRLRVRRHTVNLRMTCVRADTVEDRILALQERKRKLVSAALGDGAAGMQGAGRLTLQDLHFLFSGP